jgi:hypothetical protein
MGRERTHRAMASKKKHSIVNEIFNAEYGTLSYKPRRHYTIIGTHISDAGASYKAKAKERS